MADEDQRAADRIALIDRIATTDRSRRSPLTFVGREREIAVLNIRLAQVHDDALRSDMTSRLTSVQGIPGSGKSSLVMRFCEQASEAFGSEVAFVQTTPSVLLDPESVAQELERAQRGEANTIRLSQSKVAGDVGARVMGVGGGMKTEEITTHEHGIESRSLWTTVAERGLDPKVPIILVVEEAQKMDAVRAASVLDALHGAPLPVSVLPILVGTARLDARKREAQIYRMDDDGEIEVGALALADARRCIETCCLMFGVPPRSAKRIANAIAPRTGGFPAHVDAAVRGIAETLARNSHRIADEGGERQCVAAAAARRGRYYRRRLQAASPVPTRVFRAIAEKMESTRSGNVAPLESIRDACDAALEEAARAGRTNLPSGAEECVLRGEDAGILRYDAVAEEVVFPAAHSMADFLLGRPEPEPDFDAEPPSVASD